MIFIINREAELPIYYHSERIRWYHVVFAIDETGAFNKPQGGRQHMEVFNAVTVVWCLAVALSFGFAGFLIKNYKTGSSPA